LLHSFKVVAESRPEEAWDININGLYSVLEVPRVHGYFVFVPVSIAAFGPNGPEDYTHRDKIK